jgi:hypothetical protein
VSFISLEDNKEQQEKNAMQHYDETGKKEGRIQRNAKLKGAVVTGT